jgi:crotonobetaine/carnitine-CoA ligase
VYYAVYRRSYTEGIALNKLDLSNTADRVFPKILRAQAEQAGDSLFLLTDSQRITFAQAEATTNALAAGLKALGLGAGDRIAFYMGNCPEMVLLSLAVNKLAAIWTPISTDYKGQWLLDTLERSRCKLLVCDESHQRHIDEIRAQLDIEGLVQVTASDSAASDGAVSYAQLCQYAPLQPDYSKHDYGDTCSILWTSGTTGKSKGVLQSYNNWIRAIVSGASPMYDSREGDSIYCVLPLFNTAAWITCIYRALIEGLPCIIEEKFSVKHFWQRVRHFGATQTFAIGAMGVFLLNSPALADDADTPLRVALIVPIPPDLWLTFEQRFNVRLLRSGLGQSECQLVTTQLEDRDDVPVYALGFPLDDTELRLCDDKGVAVPAGEVGEICIKPLQPHILFNGYFDDDKATAEAYRDGYYLSGDMARQDPGSGAYFYVDRKKDAVRFAGRNISTLEVESVMRRHPAIEDVAAFGITSKEVDSEQELKLNIVLCQGHKPGYEDLCQFINDNAPHYFVPRYMEFVDSLPYTATNKVQKYRLRQQGLGEHTWDLKNSDYQVQR